MPVIQFILLSGTSPLSTAAFGSGGGSGRNNPRRTAPTPSTTVQTPSTLSDHPSMLSQTTVSTGTTGSVSGGVSITGPEAGGETSKTTTTTANCGGCHTD